jgi:hypothetical protein
VALLGFGAPSEASAQTKLPISPDQVRGFYGQASNRNLTRNATGTLVFVIWSGVRAESDTVCQSRTTIQITSSPADTETVTVSVCSPVWQGYRVRRTIQGVTPVPMGVVGQWKARDSVVPLCVAQQQPCDPTNFVFTGTGIFFKGFKNNKRTDGTYVFDYPPGAPADSDSTARVFVDLAAMAGFTTEYAVTSIDTTKIVDADFYESSIDTVITVTPATPPAPDMTQVAVVPNPYRVNAEWNPAPGQNRVHFIHLPAGATVRIYTAVGELIQTLTQDPSSSPGGETGELAWDLKNARGQDVVSGIYLYAVSPPDGRTPVRGHFVIIK